MDQRINKAEEQEFLARLIMRDGKIDPDLFDKELSDKKRVKL